MLIGTNVSDIYCKVTCIVCIPCIGTVRIVQKLILISVVILSADVGTIKSCVYTRRCCKQSIILIASSTYAIWTKKINKPWILI